MILLAQPQFQPLPKQRPPLKRGSALAGSSVVRRWRLWAATRHKTKRNNLNLAILRSFRYTYFFVFSL